MAGTRLAIVISFVVPILLLTPVALYFTGVDRSELPFHSIDALDTVDDFHASIQVVLLSTSSEEDRNSDSVSEKVKQLISPDSFSINTTVNVIHMTEELDRIDQLVRHSDATTIDTQLNHFGQQNIDGFTQSYVFFIICDLKQVKANQLWTIGEFRHGWIEHCNMEELETPLKQLKEIVQTNILPSPQDLKAEAKIALNYRLSFSLLNENPAEYAARWDFPDIAHHFLHSFVQKISALATFTVDSQVLQYARLAKQQADDRCVTTQDLTQFMSANDYLSTAVLEDREQNLNFLSYVPDPKAGPLVLADQKDGCKGKSTSRAFEIPGWGGVVILSGNPSASDNIGLDEMETAMGYFISHLRRLLGISDVQNSSIVFLPSRVHGITDWEMDVSCRSWTYRHLTSTTQTLKSIAKLVRDMPHMSVRERIETNVDQSLLALEEAYAKITPSDGQSYNPDYVESLRLARRAAAFADAAYYDSTMVPQLYFPDEHIYAVYLPLLLPVILPLLSGLKREYLRVKAKKQGIKQD